MKVISGKYKGRVLEGFDIAGTRPTMDRVKESVFAMIQSWLEDAVILDLFAGSGNLGIEALSEGAKQIYLVDKNKKACQVMKRNLDKIGMDENVIFYGDYKKALDNYKNQSLQFDIIFLDPPYQTDLVQKSIEIIEKNELLTKNGIIVAESNSLDKIIFSKKLQMIKSKKYGDKWVAILRRV